MDHYIVQTGGSRCGQTCMLTGRTNRSSWAGLTGGKKKAEHILCSLEPAWVWNPCMLNVFMFSMRLTVKAIPTVCVVNKVKCIKCERVFVWCVCLPCCCRLKGGGGLHRHMVRRQEKGDKMLLSNLPIQAQVVEQATTGVQIPHCWVCHQLSIQPNVKSGHNLLFVSGKQWTAEKSFCSTLWCHSWLSTQLTRFFRIIMTLFHPFRYLCAYFMTDPLNLCGN